MPAVTATPVVTGAEYVTQITARESDRRARAAFRSLVVRLAPPAGTLFDFGCGTGMDARFYAERGYSVSAFDVDPQMGEYFANDCRDLIEAGRVRLEIGSYDEFIARGGAPGKRAVDLVMANFAPLNLIADLPTLFKQFHALTAPRGKVLASVLSPYFVGDLKYRWWWHNLAVLLRAGHFHVAGAQAPIYRRRLSDFAAQSQPCFRLEQVFRGLPARQQAPVGRPVSGAWWRMTTCRYMFLLFAKRQVRSPAS